MLYFCLVIPAGLRSRHREIQMINNQFGRSCPTTLRQQLPCPYQPCYEWRPSNWSTCFLQVHIFTFFCYAFSLVFLPLLR